MPRRVSNTPPSPQAVIEKASIDEFYIDATAMVDAALHSEAVPVVDHADTVVVDPPLQIGNEFERRLCMGAAIASRLRGAVFDSLGFTCSAGIATTKLLAKIGSAQNKPNRQTIIPPRYGPMSTRRCVVVVVVLHTPMYTCRQ